ncbi:amino acid ABC transporter, periplasmic amino acid-binding protein, putative [Marinomonas sp. MED121]|uniref:substrate-binding periplasmic protein n=1 Tax=Marinomonas sp. MED121 TaxID=314277 RepID=UPI0000691217|nr:transporter substrate-binding domain-containing protein [Marinomonas sp. MED121]EAQ67768.1 amino acid ABC transporter, periplasmic amino acid-binding protein, putative [Marinomonas sp. MED121]
MTRLLKTLLAISLVIPSLSQAQDVSLTTTNWEPFYGENLDQGGFISALVSASFKASGYQSEIEFTQWKEAMAQVKSGEKEVLMGAYYSDERAQNYHVSIPIYSVLTGVIKHQKLDLEFYSSFEMLNQYKIGKMEGSVISQSFDAFPFESIQGYSGAEEGLQALASDNINLYADNLSVVKSIAGKMGMNPSELSMVQPPIEKNDLYIMVSKNIPNGEKIRDDFNAGFIQIQSQGIYQEILEEFNQN